MEQTSRLRMVGMLSRDSWYVVGSLYYKRRYLTAPTELDRLYSELCPETKRLDLQ